MTGARLRFPVVEFSLTAPDEVLDLVHILYPHSLESPTRAVGRTPGASLRVERCASGWRLEQDGAALGEYDSPLQAALALEYAVEAGVVRERGAWIAVHAGAVEIGGGAVLLAGDSGSGKTSCTFHLVELGHSFLAEEVALIEPDTGRVHPYLQTLSLDGRLVESRGAAWQPAGGELVCLEPGHYRYLPRTVANGSLPLRTVLVPRFSPGRTGRLERVPPEAALTELLGYCFEPTGDDEELVDRLIALIGATPILRLTYGGAAEARCLLARLPTAPSHPAAAAPERS